MEDDHVDRLDVQARQRAELTSTNRSIGLIALMIRVRINTPTTHDEDAQAAQRLPIRMLAERDVLGRSGGQSGVSQTRSHLELGR